MVGAVAAGAAAADHAGAQARAAAHAHDQAAQKKPKPIPLFESVKSVKEIWRMWRAGECHEWDDGIKKEKNGETRVQPQSRLVTSQDVAKALYAHKACQYGVAGLIVANFIQNIIQAQIDPTGKEKEKEFAVFELFFNIVFLFELALNFYAYFFRAFWKSGWNIFDWCVVWIGWMFQLGIPLPGPMKLLRMMRAFRVFRLFKRIPSLRKIMESLANAVPGVVNAFVIQIIVMCIFAIIAVDRFRDYGENGYIINENNTRIDYKTARDLNYGLEYYDQFGKAYFTMFQVLTGESWSEAIARPLVNSNTATTSTGGAIFFVLFCVLNGVVLINVVVAVLLEKMVEPEADKGSAEVEAVEEQAKLVETHIEEYEAFTKRLRQKVAELAVVKSQVAALLAHEGIKVAHS